MDALASPPPTSCPKCGDHFRRASDAMFHICRPNDGDFNPRDTVRRGDATGTVMRVDRGLVEVKFRGSISPVWCSPSLLERVA